MKLAHLLAMMLLIAVPLYAQAIEPIQVHITLSAEEFKGLEPRGGFNMFGGKPKPVDPNRELHRNAFGIQLPWGHGNVTINDQTFADVGIRYKGNGTIMDSGASAKKSFRIDLDRRGGSGRFQNSKSINLHCGVTDPTKFRETWAYELYRAAGVPAPKTAFAEVRLTVTGGKFNKDLLGLYTLTQEVDKGFLKSHFQADDGLLMKPENLREFEDQGDDWGKYSPQYRPKRDPKPNEVKRLVAFARLVEKADDDTFRQEIRGYVDIDAYLRFLATTAFIANVDCFFVLGHNYYLYLHPKTNRLHFIPWDVDRAFANLPIYGPNEKKLDLSITHPYAGNHRLTDRILAMPGVGEQYHKLFQSLAATVFSKEQLMKRLDAADAEMKDVLARDAKATIAREEEFLAVGLQAMYGKTPELRRFVERRTASVIAQLAGETKGFIPTGGFPFAPPPMPPPKAAIPTR